MGTCAVIYLGIYSPTMMENTEGCSNTGVCRPIYQPFFKRLVVAKTLGAVPINHNWKQWGSHKLWVCIPGTIIENTWGHKGTGVYTHQSLLKTVLIAQKLWSVFPNHYWKHLRFHKHWRLYPLINIENTGGRTNTGVYTPKTLLKTLRVSKTLEVYTHQPLLKTLIVAQTLGTVLTNHY